ncbi:MAG: hypothetical protein M9921_02215 [Fimbriimonadaceae bacterium]|nr:hypothetical protein [Chthonomonadaceae bacterium]MCO5295650.1 hypothetical protein [Fimbriimonadaceae bacterium]
MIVYLTTRRSSNIFRYLFRDWARSLRKTLVRATYEEIVERGSIPRATIVFTDHERMSPDLLGLARQLWDQVSPHCRALNNPHTVLTRVPLLHSMFEAGINEHRAFRPDDVPADLRYPVFVRGANDHLGPRTDLLEDREALERALVRLAVQDDPCDDLLVVEYEDCRGGDGCYRKFAAFRVGDAIIPRHQIVGDHWALKVVSPHFATRAEEECSYANENPHADQAMRAFEIAGIEYGRIDYGWVDGRIRVWEINTNPTVMSDLYRTKRSRRPLQRLFLERFLAAMADLETTPEGPDIPLAFHAPTLPR